MQGGCVKRALQRSQCFFRRTELLQETSEKSGRVHSVECRI
jgi:hypothetical protein